MTPHAQLGFPRPLTEVVTRPLLISNPNKFPVSFKVKTTAPKSYCVKPNAGFIPAGQRTEIQIMLQPMAKEPPLAAKCRDKFLVQSAAVPSHLADASAGDFWAELSKTGKDAISEQKLRVAYLPAKSAAVPEEDEEGTTSAKATPAPLTPAQLEAENTKLRAQLKSNTSRLPKVSLPIVMFLLALVAAAAAAGTWYVITNDLIKF